MKKFIIKKDNLIFNNRFTNKINNFILRITFIIIRFITICL